MASMAGTCGTIGVVPSVLSVALVFQTAKLDTIFAADQQFNLNVSIISISFNNKP